MTVTLTSPMACATGQMTNPAVQILSGYWGLDRHPAASRGLPLTTQVAQVKNYPLI